MNEVSKRKKLYVAFSIFVTILFSLTIVYWLKASLKADNANLNVEFSGLVDRVDYDIKQSPTVTVNNEGYYIAGYNTNHQIKIGDSIIKKRGSDVYKLVKSGSKEVVEFRK